MDLRTIVKNSGVTAKEFARIAKISRATLYLWYERENLEDRGIIHVVEATLKIIKKNQKKGGKNDAKNV